MMQKERGFSLIEVLVALLILSVGLLGIAGMQTLSVQMNVSARQSSQATFLAYEIIDRMRANRQAALAGDYNHDSDGCTEIPTGDSVAEVDLASWLNVLCGMTTGDNTAPATLPQDADAGTGATVDVSDGLATVSVSWFDERWEEGEEVRTVTVQVEL